MNTRNSYRHQLMCWSVAAGAGLAAASGCASTPSEAADREENAPSLASMLDARQEAFNANAPAEQRELYERGIEQIGESGLLERAKNVGDRAPMFRLPGADGGSVGLASLLVEGPVVIVWYRGGWCPYCNTQLQAWQSHVDDLEAAGGTLVAISPETPDNSLTTREKNELAYHVLTDAGNEVARAFGIVYTLPRPIQRQFNEGFDLNRWNADDSGELPLSATYVIGRDGVIRYAHLDADYRNRAEPSDVIAAVRAAR